MCFAYNSSHGRSKSNMHKGNYLNCVLILAWIFVEIKLKADKSDILTLAKVTLNNIIKLSEMFIFER